MNPKYNLVSDCCGAHDRMVGDASYEDFGICSECKEHCEYVPEEYETDFITNETI